jgi:2-phospho-L-lactate/phosphoenolpyruvate guanylyltransferase
MAIWAIVPVKPFLRSKSRLAGVLTPQERAGLSRNFLGHALEVLAQVAAVSQVLVVSRDPAALALAHERHARTVTESGAPDLNAALTRATRVAAASHAEAVLILPTDLPFLAPDDVRQLIEMDGAKGTSRASSVISIAPDRKEDGTNALFAAPPGLLAYAFGEHSFAKHLALAEATGAHVRVCRLPGVALDIDGPDDLRAYQAAREPKAR